MSIVLNIKDKSVLDFFKDKLVYNDRNHNNRSCGEDIGAYYYMKDEIFILKYRGIDIGDTVEFELIDEGRGSKKELVNKYIYSVHEYDDHSIKLVLEDFKILIKD